MVECSPTLQKLQYSTLKCVDDDVLDEDSTKRILTTLSNVPISWHATLEEVPVGCMKSCTLDILCSMNISVIYCLLCHAGFMYIFFSFFIFFFFGIVLYASQYLMLIMLLISSHSLLL